DYFGYFGRKRRFSILIYRNCMCYCAGKCSNFRTIWQRGATAMEARRGMDKSEIGTLLSKVPEVTLMFWVIKILATTLGETGGDAVTMGMKLGYLTGTLIFLSFFVVMLAFQVSIRRYHAF